MPGRQERAERRLGTTDVVVLGLAAVLGAGSFAVWGPAAAAAGRWLPLAVLIAAFAAYCSTASTAELVLAHDRSTGLSELSALDVARARLPDALGRLGSVAFLVARATAAAAVASIFASYVLPSAPLPAAIGVLVAATIANVAGVRWTVRGTYALVGGTLAVLLFVVVVSLLLAGDAPVAPAAGWSPDPAELGWGGLGITGAAAFVSFAFAGLARVGMAGGEAREPAATLCRGLLVTLAIGLAVLLLLAIALIVGMGAERLSAEVAPLAAVVDAGGAPALGMLVRVAAAVVAMSALLWVLVALTGTVVTMARAGELPRALAVTGERGTSCRAGLVSGAVAIAVVCVGGQAATIAVSACAVLIAYAVLNLAALRLPAERRRWPRWAPPVGLVLSLVMAASLPPVQVLIAVVAIAVGWAAATVRVTA
ncbi:basic amino acid/polyamine antiporter, APA family [Pseudonocardia thermophila]|uniref:Basic amino acid/polyamine antiporter, APA family n=1 Tax=Pseudonocardia thermophila TaxID=1848 RepID=A0A1M6R374_PSETH|nr:amino acid permease [Pseudonocardia thermophila]SHK26904.1 basic amino acid/polyamine antiporter, APA family [Pseudonocardia thermophila]